MVAGTTTAATSGTVTDAVRNVRVMSVGISFGVSGGFIDRLLVLEDGVDVSDVIDAVRKNHDIRDHRKMSGVIYAGRGQARRAVAMWWTGETQNRYPDQLIVFNDRDGTQHNFKFVL
jgi:hypothetical protein